MPRLACLLGEGMRERRRNMLVLEIFPLFSGRLNVKNALLIKWLLCIDQFLLNPHQFREKVRKPSPDTLFVMADQALEMWMHCFSVFPTHEIKAMNRAKYLLSHSR